MRKAFARSSREWSLLIREGCEIHGQIKCGDEDKMTSTYDALGILIYEIRKTTEIRDLIAIVCEYAIDEINKVDPKILNWEDWSKKPINKAEFLGGTLEQIARFFSDAHTFLDHTEKYHLKTINLRLDYIIGKFRDWFIWYKDRDSQSRFWGLTNFKPATIRRYPKIFKELKRMVDKGIIDVSWLDKRGRKKIDSWGNERLK